MRAEILTIIIGALPIFEVRGAIPVAIGIYHLSAFSALVFAVLGNLLPVVPLLVGLGKVADFLSRRLVSAQKFFNWLFERTRRKHSTKVENWGAIGLIIFVAIPLPLTGAWTAAILAFLFGIPFWKSFFAILLGIIISAFIILGITIGFIAVL